MWTRTSTFAVALAIVAGTMFALRSYSDAKFETTVAVDRQQYPQEPTLVANAPARIEVVGARVSVTTPTLTDYAAAMDRAALVYEYARARCNPLAGHDKDMCAVEAEAVEMRARAAADVNYNGTPSSESRSRIAHADAELMVARVACDIEAGAEEVACVERAQAARAKLVAVVVDARVGAPVLAGRP